jgi:hypothetical protein
MYDASGSSLAPVLAAMTHETSCSRRAARHPNDASVRLDTVRGELEGFCVNISRSGLRVGVATPEGDPRGLYGLSLHARISVSVDGWPPRVGRVVWRREVRGGMIVGVEFERSRRLM